MIGFFGVERRAMKSASFTKRTNCELEVHGWICERMVVVGEKRFNFSGVDISWVNDLRSIA